MIKIPGDLALVNLLTVLEQLKIQYLILIESIQRIEILNISDDMNEQLFNHRKEMENLLIRMQNFTDKYKRKMTNTVVDDSKGYKWNFKQN